MKCFARYLDPTPRKEVTIPASVEIYMYRNCTLNSEQQKRKVKPLRLRHEAIPKRTAAKGVVFDSTCTPDSTPTKPQMDSKGDERESVSSEYSTRNREKPFPSVSDSDKGREMWKKSYVAMAECITEADQPQNSKENRHLLKHSNATKYKSTEEKSDSLSWRHGGVSCRKRKLPQTLLSVLKRKPEVSVLGYLENPSNSVTAQKSGLVSKFENKPLSTVYGFPTDTPHEQQTVKDILLGKDYTADTSVVQIISDSKSEKTSIWILNELPVDESPESETLKDTPMQQDNTTDSAAIQITSESDMEHSSDIDDESLKNKSANRAVVANERDNYEVDSENSSDDDSITRKIEGSKEFRNTVCQLSDSQIEDHRNVVCLYDEDEPLENKSGWTNDSVLSVGDHCNESDEDCPFCSCHSDNEKDEQNNDTNGTSGPHDEICEIDLIDDLLDEEASYLNETL